MSSEQKIKGRKRTSRGAHLDLSPSKKVRHSMQTRNRSGLTVSHNVNGTYKHKLKKNIVVQRKGEQRASGVQEATMTNGGVDMSESKGTKRPLSEVLPKFSWQSVMRMGGVTDKKKGKCLSKRMGGVTEKKKGKCVSKRMRGVTDEKKGKCVSSASQIVETYEPGALHDNSKTANDSIVEGYVRNREDDKGGEERREKEVAMVSEVGNMSEEGSSLDDQCPSAQPKPLSCVNLSESTTMTVSSSEHTSNDAAAGQLPHDDAVEIILNSHKSQVIDGGPEPLDAVYNKGQTGVTADNSNILELTTGTPLPLAALDEVHKDGDMHVTDCNSNDCQPTADKESVGAQKAPEYEHEALHTVINADTSLDSDRAQGPVDTTVHKGGGTPVTPANTNLVEDTSLHIGALNTMAQRADIDVTAGSGYEAMTLNYDLHSIQGSHDSRMIGFDAIPNEKLCSEMPPSFTRVGMLKGFDHVCDHELAVPRSKETLRMISDNVESRIIGTCVIINAPESRSNDCHIEHYNSKVDKYVPRAELKEKDLPIEGQIESIAQVSSREYSDEEVDVDVVSSQSTDKISTHAHLVNSIKRNTRPKGAKKFTHKKKPSVMPSRKSSRIRTRLTHTTKRKASEAVSSESEAMEVNDMSSLDEDQNNENTNTDRLDLELLVEEDDNNNIIAQKSEIQLHTEKKIKKRTEKCHSYMSKIEQKINKLLGTAEGMKGGTLTDATFIESQKTAVNNLQSKMKKYLKLLNEKQLKTGESNIVMCLVCNNLFFNERARDQHMDKMHRERIKCTVDGCKSTFKDTQSRDKHTKEHDKVANHVCPKCGAKFPYKSRLLKHMEGHNEDRAYECTKCGRKYKQKSALTRHAKECSLDENTVKTCRFPNCTYIQRNIKNYNEHLRTFHSVENLCKCVICGKRFKFREQVKRHIKQAHASEVSETAQILSTNTNNDQ